MFSRPERIEQALIALSGHQHLYPAYFEAMLAEENERAENERPRLKGRRSPRDARNRRAAS